MFFMRSALLLMPLGAACWAGEADGAWKLNAARSTFAGDTQPRSFTIRIEPHGKGEVFTLDRIEADVRAISCSTILNLDGRERDFRDSECSGRNRRGELTAGRWKSSVTAEPALGPGSSGGRRQRANSFWRFRNNTLTAAASTADSYSISNKENVHANSQ